MLYVLPLIGTFQSCQLRCRIRNLTLQQSVFRFQAVQMTRLQGGICSMQESIEEQVKMAVYKGSCPNTMPQPARHSCQEGVLAQDDRKTCSVSEPAPERCYRQFPTLVRLQLDYMCSHLTDRSSNTPSVHTIPVLQATCWRDYKRACFITPSPLNALQVTPLNFSQSEQLIRCKQIEKLYTWDNSFFKRPLI